MTGNNDKWSEVVINLKSELSQLARYVDKTRKGMADVELTVKAGAERMPEASEELSGVTGELEKAAHRIMSILEGVTAEQEKTDDMLKKLSAWAQSLPEEHGGEGVALVSTLISSNDVVKANMTDILMTLSFQDLTGQKLKKIMSRLTEVETRILEMALSFGLQTDVEESVKEEKEEMLKELKDTAPADLTQDMVDKILQGL